MGDLASTPTGWDYAARITEVRARVHEAEVRAGRAGAAVRVMLATKAWGPDAAAAAVRAAQGVGGRVLVGESRMQ
jgi:uncharacterized pyridoxal phosphate-containing UPF0001 family protein